MSAPKYQYGHKPGKRRPRKTLAVIVLSCLILGLVGVFIYLDLKRSSGNGIEGSTRVVSQVLSESNEVITIEEPFFKLELPGDWKEIARNDNAYYDSISWQATKKGQENRYLTLYYDRIPLDMPVNRLVAVAALGDGISFGNVSDNCATFTLGGTFDTNVAPSLKPTLTKWNKVDFLCNLPRVTDNQIGTGAEGSINVVTVTGPTKGAHKYFFVYTDRNFRQDYGIFYDVLRSFQAK